MDSNSKILGSDCGHEQYQIVQTKNELRKLQRIIGSVNLMKLPDKGAKLKKQIDDLENHLQSLNLDSVKSCVKKDLPKDADVDVNLDSVKLCVKKDLPKDAHVDVNLDSVKSCVKKDLPKDENVDVTNLVQNTKELADNNSKYDQESDHNYNNKAQFNAANSSLKGQVIKNAFHVKEEYIEKCSKFVDKDKTAFNNTNLASFKELASKNVSCVNEINTKSPSFTTWRDSGRKTQLTEALPLFDKSNVKRSLGHQFSVKPLIDVNEENVKKIQNTLVTFPDDTLEESDPENLKTNLMTHQRRALSWLIWREKQDPSGGILADDMGLGKTLTMISLILKQKEEDNYFASESEKYESRGTLIVCLASIIHQWKDEINKHCNHDALEVNLYHGPKRDRNYKNTKRNDVVLTTYNILMAENKLSGKNNKESPLFRLKWERIILDEAHTIKNHASQTAQAIFSLKGYRKWAVTGTPIHNVFKDMYSLVKFLQFAPFDDYKKFKKLTDDFSESSEKRKKLLVKSLVLRRTKEQADEEGKPLVEMKGKTFSVCYIELSDAERKVYETLEEKTTKKFDQYLMKQSKMKSSNLLTLLLRLQQCCCHVSLLGKEVEEDDISSDITKTLSSLAIDSIDSDSSSTESSLDLTFSELEIENLSDKAVKSSKIKKLFEELNKISKESNNEDKSVIVSQWVSLLDIIAYHLNQENIKYHLIAGSTKAEDRQKFMEDFNTKDNVKVMLLSLKAGGVGLNLTGANHLFLLDLHWNPALEMQACDRIHRVGQKKDVKIYKFICKNTIEEKIQSLQENKRSIASSALHGVKQETKGMTFEDFKDLFRVKA